MFEVALVLIVFATLIALGTWYGILRACRDGRGFSTVPILSLLLCGAARSLTGDRMGPWVFGPAVLDPATWSLLWLPIHVLIRWARSGRDG